MTSLEPPNYSRRLLLLSGLLLVPFLSACSGPPNTGPGEVKWDRDACERCRMVLSDRKHATQVRYFPVDQQRSKLMKFDDLGCALIWLEDKPWRDDPQTQIWVVDRNHGGWIEARSATYVLGDVTPMEYGLGAQAEAAENGLDFARAKAHIFEVEQRFNLHGTDLLKRLEERRSGTSSDQDTHLHTATETRK